MRAKNILIVPTLLLTSFMLIGSCAKKHSSSADNSTSTFTVSEITQTAGSDGFSGFFVIPDNGISQVEVQAAVLTRMDTQMY